jgi:hypothetical protein
MLDTEADKGLYYAEFFQFRHVPFAAPFGSLDYLAAVQHCVRQGAGTVIIDSGSHEHENTGGYLDTHEAELERIAGDDFKKRERVKFLAWVKPSANRRHMLNVLGQLKVNVIWCFRAKEKLKIMKGQEPIELGWQAIAGDEVLYELPLRFLLPPGSDGVPNLSPSMEGEKLFSRLPVQFRGVAEPGKPLDEVLGEKLARWAAGGSAAETPASGATGAQAGGQGQKQEDAGPLRAEILALLRTNYPPPEKEPEGLDALQHASGLRSWKEVSKLGAGDLQKVLAALKMNLNPAAHMEREPGEDSGTEPGEEG